MRLNFVYENTNFRKPFLRILYRNLLKQAYNLQDPFCKQFYLKIIKEKTKKNKFLIDFDAIRENILKGKALLSILEKANIECDANSIEKMIRIAYNQSSVFIRNEKMFTTLNSEDKLFNKLKPYLKTEQTSSLNYIKYVLNITMDLPLPQNNYKNDLEYLRENNIRKSEEKLFRPIPESLMASLAEMVKSEHPYSLVFTKVFPQLREKIPSSKMISPYLIRKNSERLGSFLSKYI